MVAQATRLPVVTEVSVVVVAELFGFTELEIGRLDDQMILGLDDFLMREFDQIKRR